MADIVFDEAALAKLFDGPNSEAGKFLKKKAVQVESAAKRNTPVETGRLRASMTHEMGTEGRDIVARVGTNVDYAIYVELGTRYFAARAMLRNAVSAARR